MHLKRTFILAGITMTLFACKSATNTTTAVASTETMAVTENKVPKNVILLISDGTGLSQISSAFFFKDSEPNYTRFKDIGLIKTSSSREEVTDSAAGATAFACGVKTYNGAIGVADDSTHVKNLVEIASTNGIKTGLVATSSITHATPASFFAHTLNRGSAEEIAAYMPTSGVDFFAGGGLQYFNKRKDGKNLLNALEANKFTIDTTALGDLAKIRASEKVAYLLADDAMKPAAKGRGDFLSKATSLAIDYLSKDDEGFFMMAEGSQIDWGGHSNNGPYLVSELIDFDDAIGKALDYAEKDGNTLVVVTSDHETGGFTLSAKKKKKEDGTEYNDYSEVGMTFSTGGHSAALIPVFAYGPGSESFIGIYENNDIFEKILELTQWNR